MTEQIFTLANKTGLHARPAALFIQTVNKYPGNEVSLISEGKEVNGRSLLSILSLGAGPAARITVRVAGPQENELMQALHDLIQGGFGE